MIYFITGYFIIGLIISIFEWILNSGNKLKLFDLVNFLFWLPLLFCNKEKLYNFLHPKGD